PEGNRDWRRKARGRREFAVTPLDQLRLRLPEHDFARLMETAKPLAALERDAFLKDVAAELGQHEVVGPGLLHRSGRIEARSGLRMMPRFPRSPLSFR